jgi:hypothetical protein
MIIWLWTCVLDCRLFSILQAVDFSISIHIIYKMLLLYRICVLLNDHCFIIVIIIICSGHILHLIFTLEVYCIYKRFI